MTDVHPNVQLVRDYLAALQNGEAGEALARFFTDDALQRELPNRLNPKGQESDLASLMARSVQGKHALTSQKYEILNEVAQGERVAIEALWTGKRAIAIGSLPAGAELRAHFGIFFECQNGRIRRQHNYDCFESWEPACPRRLTTACSDPDQHKVHAPDCIASFGISAHAPHERRPVADAGR